MFISPAYAADAAGGGGDFLSLIAPMIMIFAVFYFLMIRPQQRKAKEHQEMVQNVRRGDEVVTAGGLIGKVAKVSEGEEIQVDLAEGVRVRVVKGTLANVRSKTEPAPQAANSNKDK